MKTIDLLKDSASFRGLEGVSTFTNPNASIIQESDSTAGSELDDDEESMDETTVDSVVPVFQPSAPVPESSTINKIKKRKHGEDNKDVQLRVLRKEETIQDMKIDNLELEKTKIELEIVLMQKRISNFVSYHNQEDQTSSQISSKSGDSEDGRNRKSSKNKRLF